MEARIERERACSSRQQAGRVDRFWQLKQSWNHHWRGLRSGVLSCCRDLPSSSVSEAELASSDGERDSAHAKSPASLGGEHTYGKSPAILGEAGATYGKLPASLGGERTYAKTPEAMMAASTRRGKTTKKNTEKKQDYGSIASTKKRPQDDDPNKDYAFIASTTERRKDDDPGP